MSIMDKVRYKMQSFLQINPAGASSINIQEYLDWEANAIKNRIWYRGDGAEIEQLYWQLMKSNTQKMFWSSHPTPGIEMRKVHTGLPAMIVDLLTDIIKGAVNQVSIIEDADDVSAVWHDMEKEIDVKALVGKCVSENLIIGDGAYKISFDTAVSKYPIVEYWAGDKVEFRRSHGRITEVVFKSLRKTESGTFELKEVYGHGYVDYELYRQGEPIELTIAPEFRDLARVEWGTDLIMAVPCKFHESARWPGRGQSVYDRKIDAFDSLDEAYSQWIDALRAGRTKEYIPENLIPRNPRTGKPNPPNSFDNRFIMTESDMRETAKNQIQTESAEIQYESYAATYAAALELCLMKLLSPSTLGIDIKKLDNAEAQREKEKVTLYTRDAIVEALQPVLEQVIDTTIKFYYLMTGDALPDYSVEVSFQSYANPSFESQVETIGKARSSKIMSIEAAVEELYGDSRDDDWKAEEIARLKGESDAGKDRETLTGNAGSGSEEVNGAGEGTDETGDMGDTDR